MLTPREQKGINFERRVKNQLDMFGFYNEWNPLGKGSDFKVGNIEVEAKFSHAVIYPSWILRDWIPRFRGEHKVVVINRGMKLHPKAKGILRKHHITIVTFDHLVGYLLMLCSKVTSYGTLLTKLLNYRRRSSSTNRPNDRTLYKRICGNLNLETLRQIVREHALNPNPKVAEKDFFIYHSKESLACISKEDGGIYSEKYEHEARKQAGI